MSNANDFFGSEIKEGDEVAFMQIGYRNLVLGRVISIHPKTLFIQQNSSTLITKQKHEQVIVKPKAELNHVGEVKSVVENVYW